MCFWLVGCFCFFWGCWGFFWCFIIFIIIIIILFFWGGCCCCCCFFVVVVFVFVCLLFFCGFFFLGGFVEGFVVVCENFVRMLCTVREFYLLVVVVVCLGFLVWVFWWCWVVCVTFKPYFVVIVVLNNSDI